VNIEEAPTVVSRDKDGLRVVILRGLPGSGKSHYTAQLVAGELKRGHAEPAVVSADQYRYVEENGRRVYRYDPRKDSECHAACLRDFLAYVQHPANLRGARYLVVDNTNLSAWEVAPYYAVANALKRPAGSVVEVIILTVHCPPEVCVKRNVHGLPAAKVYDMWFRLCEPLPARWNQDAIHSH
jgi:tRNA uridine 5-carbamoylmethylation protein Kti12